MEEGDVLVLVPGEITANEVIEGEKEVKIVMSTHTKLLSDDGDTCHEDIR